jgi:hypothetical protein
LAEEQSPHGIGGYDREGDDAGTDPDGKVQHKSEAQRDQRERKGEASPYLKHVPELPDPSPG